MAKMTTSTFPKDLWPGVKAHWGMVYPEHEQENKQLFDWQDSDKAYEEFVERVGMGLATVKGQGERMIFDSMSQGLVNRASHVAYGIACTITYEAIRDGLYGSLGEQAATAMKFAMTQTKEIVAANIYNRAFDSNYTYADGKVLCATDHPTASGAQSNRLSSDANLSEKAIEDMVTMIMNVKDNRGRPRKLMPDSLIVGTADWANAERILKSTLKNDTAENAINVLKLNGTIPKVAVNHYFTPGATFWFIRTNCPYSMMGFKREGLQLDRDNDFLSKDQQMSCYERYSFLPNDFRGLFGSQ